MKKTLLFLFALALITACSSTPSVKTPDIAQMIGPEILSAKKKKVSPEWTMFKSGAHYDSKKNPVFYGLGLVSPDEISSDKELLSKDRARDELARALTSYMKRLATNLSSALEELSSELSRSRINSLLEEHTATILMESEIANNWSNPNNGKVYSMAKLDLSRLTDKLDNFVMVSKEDKLFLRNSIIQTHSSMANETINSVALVKENPDSQPKLERRISY